MKTNILSLFLLMSGILGSCTSFNYEIDLEGRIPDQPIIRLHSMLETGSETTLISAAIASPISQDKVEKYEFPTLQVSINGQQVTTLEDSGLPTLYKNEKIYLLKAPLHPGDEVTLEAQAPDVSPAHCTVQILPELPAMTITHEVKLGNKISAADPFFGQARFRKLTEFQITLDEAPTSGNFYAVRVVKFMETDQIIGNDYNVELDDEPYIWRESERPSGYPEEIYTTGDEGTLMFYDRSFCKDGKIVLPISVLHEDTSEEYKGLKVRYKLIVSRVSPQYYNIVRLNCQLSKDPIADLISNSLALAGSNVTGGTGIVASMTVKESDWIDVK